MLCRRTEGVDQGSCPLILTRAVKRAAAELLYKPCLASQIQFFAPVDKIGTERPNYAEI
jgi:hypothetical protein